MTDQIRMRATVRDGITEVRLLVPHPMETGQRKDASGNLIPAHHISSLTVSHNGELLLASEMGRSVSANPHLTFKFKGGEKGDKLSVSWLDNQQQSRTEEGQIN